MKRILIALLLILFAISQIAQVNKSFNSLDKEVVLKRLYDNAEINMKNEILWKPNYSEELLNVVSDDNFCHTIMDTIMYYRTYRYDNAVVIFTTYSYMKGEKETCHACPASIGIALFSRSIDSNWELMNFQKNFKISGTYGKRNAMYLSNIGKDMYCLTDSSGDGNNGYFDSQVLFYSLDISEGFNQIFWYEAFYSDKGAKENGYESNTTIRFIPNKEKYYTIELTETKSNTKNIEKRTYKYFDEYERYILIKKVIVNGVK